MEEEILANNVNIIIKISCKPVRNMIMFDLLKEDFVIINDYKV